MIAPLLTKTKDMIHFSSEIEKCLREVQNSNNKEQNFQGRLYAHFLPFEKKGYVVEMETSINDEHLKPILKKRLADSNDKDFTKSEFRKREIDLLIYKPDYSEIYAAELKWIYYRDTGWNVVDHLRQFEDDAIFCHQLVNQAHFTQTCSVVVYDFDPNKQVKDYRPRNEKTKQAKLDFLGGAYLTFPLGGYIKYDEQGTLTSFEWKNMPCKAQNQKYRYYLISFPLKS